MSSVEVTGQALKGIGKFPLDKYYGEGNTFVTQARWAVFFWQMAQKRGGHPKLTEVTEKWLASP